VAVLNEDKTFATKETTKACVVVLSSAVNQKMRGNDVSIIIWAIDNSNCVLTKSKLFRGAAVLLPS
jgi:hypothetical protein